MKTQKLIALLLALVMVVALVGCDSGTEIKSGRSGSSSKNKTGLQFGTEENENPLDPDSNGQSEAWTAHSSKNAQIPDIVSFLHIEEPIRYTKDDGTLYALGCEIDMEHEFLLDEYIELLESCYHLKPQEKVYQWIILYTNQINIVFDYVGDDPDADTLTDEFIDSKTVNFKDHECYEVEYACNLRINRDSETGRSLVRMYIPDGFEVVDYGERASEIPVNMRGNSSSGSSSGSGSSINSTGAGTKNCKICRGVGYTDCKQCDGDGWMESSGYVPGYAGGGGTHYNEKKPCTNPRCDNGKKDCPLCP